jgi:segregation and condensation protein B
MSELDESGETRDIENLKRIEAALFVAGKWLSLQELVTLTDLNPITIKETLQILCNRYAEFPGAIEILVKENLWKMDVKPQYLNMVNKLAAGTSEFTRAEQETLAVIAYKQPVKQSLIVKIRGNKAYEHVKRFIQLSLVKAKKMGHTRELSLSEEFYEYFHVGKGEDEEEPESDTTEK